MSKVLFIHAADKVGHRAVQLVFKWNDVIHVQTLVCLKKNEMCEDAELSVTPSNFPCCMFHIFILGRIGTGFPNSLLISKVSIRFLFPPIRAGHVSRIGEKRNACWLLVGKPEGKIPLGRPRRRWVDNIRTDLGEVGWGDVDWIGLAQDRNRWIALGNSVLNLRVP
jgi:hypothetical protein